MSDGCQSLIEEAEVWMTCAQRKIRGEEIRDTEMGWGCRQSLVYFVDDWIASPAVDCRVFGMLNGTETEQTDVSTYINIS